MRVDGPDVVRDKGVLLHGDEEARRRRAGCGGTRAWNLTDTSASEGREATGGRVLRQKTPADPPSGGGAARGAASPIGALFVLVPAVAARSAFSPRSTSVVSVKP